MCYILKQKSSETFSCVQRNIVNCRYLLHYECSDISWHKDDYWVWGEAYIQS